MNRNPQAEYYVNEGIHTYESGDYAGAMKCFDKAIEIDPGYRYAYNNRYYLRKELKQDEKAAEDRKKMEEIDKEWVRENKENIINRFCSDVEVTERPSVIFMCGSSGAGKTEEARSLKEDIGYRHYVHIEQDAIKEMIPGYTGGNAEIFQTSATKGLSFVVDYCYKHDYSFILDSTFSKYDIADRNIRTALKKNRYIEIVYIYHDPVKTWGFVKDREDREGRSVPIDAFVNSYFGAFETIKEIKDVYGSKITLHVINKDTGGEMVKNVDRIDTYVNMPYHSRDDLRRLVEKMEKNNI